MNQTEIDPEEGSVVYFPKQKKGDFYLSGTPYEHYSDEHNNKYDHQNSLINKRNIEQQYYRQLDEFNRNTELNENNFALNRISEKEYLDNKTVLQRPNIPKHCQNTSNIENILNEYEYLSAEENFDKISELISSFSDRFLEKILLPYEINEFKIKILSQLSKDGINKKPDIKEDNNENKVLRFIENQLTERGLIEN